MKASKTPPNNRFVQHRTYRNKSGNLLNACALAAIIGLSAGSSSAAGFANFLFNPGFEQGTNGWTIVAPWAWNGPSYAVQNTNQQVQNSGTPVSVHGGTNAMKVWGYFQTYRTTPGAMQTFPAAPGSTWSSDGYVSTQVPDNFFANGNGVGCRSYLQMLFLDVNKNINAPLAVYTSTGLDLSSPTSTWIYQQVNDGSGGTNLLAPGGTAYVRLQIIVDQPGPSGAGTAGNPYVYPGGSCYWDDVTLFKTSKPDPEITVQPVATETNVYGTTASFSVVADGLTALTYKWQKDGADISNPNASGVNTATLTLSNVTTAVQGNYTCTVSDAAGPLTSNPGQLTVLDPGVLWINPPLGQTVTNGSTAKITVSAAGSTALTYSWQTNGVTLTDNGHISGSTTSNLTIANLTAADAGTYTVLINGGTVLASSGLKVVSAAQLGTNLLVNPGFEDGVWSEPWENGWTKFNGTALLTSSDFYDVLNQQGPVIVWAGTYVGEVYGSDADDGYYQNVPVTAGATYHAGGMAYMSSFTPVNGPVFITLQLFFKDSGGNTLTNYTAFNFSTNANMTTDTWIPLQVTNGTSADLVAPPGTVLATMQVYEFNWSYQGGAAAFDNLYLTLAQGTAPPQFSIKPSVSGNQIHISFPTANGVTYDVLSTGDLKTPIASWQTIGTVAGDGTVKSVADTLGAGSRFYRVRAH